MQSQTVAIGTDESIAAILDVIEQVADVQFDRATRTATRRTPDGAITGLLIEPESNDPYNWALDVSGDCQIRIAREIAEGLAAATRWRVSVDFDDDGRPISIGRPRVA